MPFKVEYPIVIIKFTIEKAPTAILSQPTLFSFTRLLSHSFTLCLRSLNRLSATEQSEHVCMWGYLLEWMQVYFRRTSNVILCCPLYSAVNVFVCSLQKNMSPLTAFSSWIYREMSNTGLINTMGTWCMSPFYSLSQLSSVLSVTLLSSVSVASTYKAVPFFGVASPVHRCHFHLHQSGWNWFTVVYAS